MSEMSVRPFVTETDEQMEHRLSQANSDKLDRVLFLLEGEGAEAPGLLRRVATHNTILLGENGHNGIVQKVNIMWRIHVWLLCGLSGSLGFLIKTAIDKLWKP